MAAAIAAAFLVTSMARSTRAAEGERRPGVLIVLRQCDARLEEEMRRIAMIELRASALDSPGSTTRVEVVCEGDVAVIRVEDPTTSKSLERSVRLSEAAPSARARLLALAIAELVAASWSELETNAEPQVPPATPPAPPAAREAARRVVARLPIEVSAVADVTTFLRSDDLVAGGGLRVEPWVSRTWLLRGEVLAHHADLSRASGAIALDTLGGSLAFGASVEGRLLRATATLGLAGGYGRMIGLPLVITSAGHLHSGVWLGPQLSGEMALWPRARLHPTLALGIGAAFLGVDGTVAGDRDVRLSGVWTSLSVGIALR